SARPENLRHRLTLWKGCHTRRTLRPSVKTERCSRLSRCFQSSKKFRKKFRLRSVLQIAFLKRQNPTSWKCRTCTYYLSHTRYVRFRGAAEMQVRGGSTEHDVNTRTGHWHRHELRYNRACSNSSLKLKLPLRPCSPVMEFRMDVQVWLRS